MNVADVEVVDRHGDDGVGSSVSPEARLRTSRFNLVMK